MQELDFIKNERVKLQQEYFKNVKNVWLEFEGEEADKKHKSIYNKYRNKDKFLDFLALMIQKYQVKKTKKKK